MSLKIVPIKRHKAFEKVQRRTASRTIETAKAFGCAEVLIIGIDRDGDLLVRSHPNDPGNALWLMERAKHHLLTGTS